METWELIAREQIRDLVAAYAHCADGGRFDELVALFATDGVLETPDGQMHRGRAAIRAFLGGTKTDLASATTAGWIRHHVSSVRLAVASASAKILLGPYELLKRVNISFGEKPSLPPPNDTKFITKE